MRATTNTKMTGVLFFFFGLLFVVVVVVVVDVVVVVGVYSYFPLYSPRKFYKNNRVFS